jgi:hypothetical protein
MKLLSVSHDAKTIKGEKKGYLTGILYLAPADSSGVTNTCASASAGCKAACLFTAGRAAAFPMINRARIRKTKFLIQDRSAFVLQLCSEIEALVRKAKRDGLKPCVRLNGTSDLPYLAHTIAPMFPHVQLYDYTKHPRPWERTLPNYHLTFSLSETNIDDAMDALMHGVNVAVVFGVKRGHQLPKTWQGYKVYDGDLHDLRFKTDPHSRIIGLRAKGRARKDCSGFVQPTTHLVQQPQLIQIMEVAA